MLEGQSPPLPPLCRRPCPATTHSDTLSLPPLVTRQAHSLTHCPIAWDDPTASELPSDGCECTHTMPLCNTTSCHTCISLIGFCGQSMRYVWCVFPSRPGSFSIGFRTLTGPLKSSGVGRYQMRVMIATHFLQQTALFPSCE